MFYAILSAQKKFSPKNWMLPSISSFTSTFFSRRRKPQEKKRRNIWMKTKCLFPFLSLQVFFCRVILLLDFVVKQKKIINKHCLSWNKWNTTSSITSPTACDRYHKTLRFGSIALIEGFRIKSDWLTFWGTWESLSATVFLLSDKKMSIDNKNNLFNGTKLDPASHRSWFACFQTRKRLVHVDDNVPLYMVCPTTIERLLNVIAEDESLPQVERRCAQGGEDSSSTRDCGRLQKGSGQTESSADWSNSDRPDRRRKFQDANVIVVTHLESVKQSSAQPCR